MAPHYHTFELPDESKVTSSVTPKVWVAALEVRVPFDMWSCAAEGFIHIRSSLSTGTELGTVRS